MFKVKAKKILKIVTTAATIVLIVAVIALVYSLIVHSRVNMNYLITANLIVGALIIATGIFTLIRPTGRKGDALIDSSTYVERTQDARERKKKLGNELLFTGLAAVFVTLVLEVVLWLIV